MKKLENDTLALMQGGGFCAKAGGFLGGLGVGVAGLTYFGIATVITGGAAGVVLAVAGVALGIYCAN